MNENFLEEQFYDDLRKELLDEGAFMNAATKAATILGCANITLFAGLGAALIAKSTVSKKGKIHKFFEKIFKRKSLKNFDLESAPASATKELDNFENMKTKLADVFKAIENKDADEARRLFKDSDYYDDADAIKAIAIKITDVYGEPPMYIYPSGNESYFALKTITNPKVGRAVSNAVLSALRRDKSYYSELKKQDLVLEPQNAD